MGLISTQMVNKDRIPEERDTYIRASFSTYIMHEDMKTYNRVQIIATDFDKIYGKMILDLMDVNDAAPVFLLQCDPDVREDAMTHAFCSMDHKELYEFIRNALEARKGLGMDNGRLDKLFK